MNRAGLTDVFTSPAYPDRRVVAVVPQVLASRNVRERISHDRENTIRKQDGLDFGWFFAKNVRFDSVTPATVPVNCRSWRMLFDFVGDVIGPFKIEAIMMAKRNLSPPQVTLDLVKHPTFWGQNSIYA
ncbi:hypothetical protein [Rhizobium sp. GCM10022189]|uniref:hypothetical protein n=1 Tax=Rhizobium sp. GCM10022189 TaxID=3252654 RepID=UPI0036196F6B